MKDTTRNIVVKNFLWRFAERVGAQGVKLIVEIILARLLLPDDYGLVALITVFITILNVFVDSGLGNALIQKKDADELDFSTVFWFNIVWCVLLYSLLFITAPIIASFYDNNEIVPVIRVLGLQIVISGVKNVQQAYVSRNMQFKRFFFATLGGTIGAAAIGIWMAYNSFGVWAIVAQQLFNVLVDTIILWITVKWRPRYVFSFERLKRLYSYGWKLLASALIETVYNEIRQLVIGKFYSSADLAYYNRGKQFPYLFVTNINSGIDSVLLPIMSKEQDNSATVKIMTRRAITTSVYIIAPLMMGLAFVGEPLVRLLLTEKWLSCVPFLRIFCITFMFYPIHTANLNAIKALGRSDLFLKLEIIKKFVGILALVLTMRVSVMAMAYSLLFVEVAGQIINTWPNKKLLNYSYLEQLKDIMPSVLLSVFMGICVFFVDKIGMPDILTIFLQIVLGGVIYNFGSIFLKIDSFLYVKDIVKSFTKKSRN